MNYFTMGYWIIGLSIAVSTVGATVGFACVRRSMRSATTMFRMVWQLFAAVAIGGVGIWLAVFVSLLNVTVSGSLVRYDVLRVSETAALTVLAVFVGSACVERTLQPLRLVACGVVMGAGVGAAHYLTLGAIDIQGSITTQPAWVTGSIAIAVVSSLAALWFTLEARSLSAMFGAAVVFACAVAGMHYTGLAALHVAVRSTGPVPPGEDLFEFLVPVYVIGMLSLAVPISAILVGPDQRIPAPGRAAELETAH